MICVDSFQEVLNECSSKGNQHKFYKNGIWVKIDNQGCCEGLAEEFVSEICKCIYDFPFVEYKSDSIVYNDTEYLGCYSRNMYNDTNITFISCRKLFNNNGVALNTFIRQSDTIDNIKAVVYEIERLTGINTLDYFRRLLYLDSFIINEDRHYMNVGICQNILSMKYGVAPCFDNGSSLFCTNWTYRKKKSLDENIKSACSVARPFSKFFDKQVDALQRLGCKPLYIDYNKLIWLLNNYHNILYSDEMNIRIKSVVTNRLQYYNGKSFIYV